MDLREKLRQLRAAEGARRGLGRPLTQSEVARAMRDELGASLSQAYLSQLEGGKRVHLTHTSREALARFYRVHPGYLVSDLPDGSGLDRRGTDSHEPPSFAPPRERPMFFPPHEPLTPLTPRVPSAFSSREPPTPFPPREPPTIFPPRSGDETAQLPRGWISFDRPDAHAGRPRSDLAGDLTARLRRHPHSRVLLPLVERLLALTPPQLDAVRREVDRLQRGGEP